MTFKILRILSQVDPLDKARHDAQSSYSFVISEINLGGNKISRIRESGDIYISLVCMYNVYRGVVVKKNEMHGGSLSGKQFDRARALRFPWLFGQ